MPLKSKFIPLVFPLAFLLLTGCGTTHTITLTQTVVIVPPEALYVCPDLPPLPKGKASDADVANLLVGTAKVAIECKQSLKAVHDNIDKQQAIVNNTKVKPTDDQ